jgi:fibronectin type 3 domain-containing protein
MKKAVILALLSLCSTFPLFAQSAKVERRSTVPTVGLSVTQGTQHQVSLAWSSTCSSCTFTVYRGTTSGGETGLLSGITTTSFIDTGVTNATTDYYYVTASQNGDESKGSNEVSATIPSNPVAPTGLVVTSVK